MRTVCIVQARMSSSRLPGKVLIQLGGKEVLAHVIDRLSLCRELDDVVVATSNDPSDDVLENWCMERNIKVFRGSLNDVLDRYYKCAIESQADCVIRITADCPLLDPQIVDEIVNQFKSGAYDLYYLSGEFPDGLDCAAFSFFALENAWHQASLPSEREHVGPYILKHPEYFRIGSLEKFKGLARHRWTLDEDRDLMFLNVVIDHFQSTKNNLFSTDDLINFLALNPGISDINRDIIRNEGLLKSIVSDGKD